MEEEGGGFSYPVQEMELFWKGGKKKKKEILRQMMKCGAFSTREREETTWPATKTANVPLCFIQGALTEI